MIYRYFCQTIKYIFKNKVDSLINIIGLTIGITSFIILINYVSFEFSFDKTIPNHNNIYRIVTDVPQQNGNVMNTAMSSSLFTKSANEYFSEILATTSITPSFETYIKVDDISTFESNFWFADSSFFNIFQFDLIQGNPKDVLNGPFKIVISERMAKKYFGNSNPINQTIVVHNTWDYTVSGIIKNTPSNLHLDIDFLATPDSIRGFNRNNWGALSLFNYILLEEGTDPITLEQSFHNFSIERMGESWANIVQFKLQAINDIHLKSDRLHEVAKTSNIQQLYYLIGIALLILLMVGVNFMNIYSSRAEYRSKEVGLKKVVGAQRIDLIVQFLVESLLYTIISVCISIVIVYYTWNIFETFLGIDIPFQTNKMLYFLITVILFTGIISGLYPAIYLSSFKPIYAIKALFRNKKNGSFIRKALVITQFSLSIFMIIATLIVMIQMRYVKNKDLGFDKENLLITTIQTTESTKAEYKSIPGVNDICFSSVHIDNILSGQQPYILEDSVTTENTMDYMIRTIWVDDNFIPLYKINLSKGRNFSRDFSTDHDNAIIANQAAIKLLGIKNPIGKVLISARKDSNYVHRIIGVMEDFNYQSLHSPIEPIFFRFGTENLSVMSIKTNNKNQTQVIQSVEKKTSELSPDLPTHVNILSQKINEHYEKEEKISTLYIILTILSILIASLGLFGIVSFILEKKTKATGIRKVLGASNLNLFISLSKDLLIWLCIATIISFPISYIVMNKWLQGFAYKSVIHWWIFPLSFIILFTISILTISYKTYKSIRVNPAECLKYE
ncbi:MAG: ABC transporter permease [Bacteroidales bacterium]|nr:ABC transporter permease [Bacteroidales bacterium]